MPASTPRTRLIFQNVNAFVGPAAGSGTTATGAHYTGGNVPIGNLVAELANVTSATLNVGINRQDINIFGVLQRQDNIIIAPPSITMDLSWNVTDGYNESMIGFHALGAGSMISGILTKVSDSKNYFLSISQQGVDDDGVANPNQRDVLAVGNGFISNYTFNAAVGQVSTASVSIDAMNVVGYTGASGNAIPAINPNDSSRITTWNFQLPTARVITGGNNVFALRPGDITLGFPTNAGFLAPLSGQNAINIQSVSLSVPISRVTLDRLNSAFGFSREIQFPVNCSMAIRALATEINPTSFDSLYCNDQAYDLRLTQRQPSCNGTGLNAIIIDFNEAKVASWSEGITIGGEASIDLSLTAQIAGAGQSDGINFSGYGAVRL